ncbi:MAG: hypothetical protein ABGX10_02135 [Paracoccus sp. (in: a-proteobacteria)]|uniref:hypothetical protein n=1 Tax=Paracoccus sp. TaxID=267 RepID=UPI003242CA0E
MAKRYRVSEFGKVDIHFANPVKAKIEGNTFLLTAGGAPACLDKNTLPQFFEPKNGPIRSRLVDTPPRIQTVLSQTQGHKDDFPLPQPPCATCIFSAAPSTLTWLMRAADVDQKWSVWWRLLKRSALPRI